MKSNSGVSTKVSWTALHYSWWTCRNSAYQRAVVQVRQSVWCGYNLFADWFVRWSPTSTCC